MSVREPLAQPITLDFDQVSVRNPARGLELLGFSGMIVMWSRPIQEIPDGWALCDGRNGTPDLRDCFPVGASKDVSGFAQTTLTGVPTRSGGSVEHTHTFKTEGHTHFTKSGAGIFQSAVDGIDLVKEKDSGTTDKPNTVPVPYVAVVFIMKL